MRDGDTHELVHSFRPVALASHSFEDHVSAHELLSLVQQQRAGEKPDLASNLSPPVFVPESLTGMELLQNFRSSNAQLVFVIDEYGEVEGMVTLRDLIEAITGEFKPHGVEEPWAVQRAVPSVAESKHLSSTTSSRSIFGK